MLTDKEYRSLCSRIIPARPEKLSDALVVVIDLLYELDAQHRVLGEDQMQRDLMESVRLLRENPVLDSACWPTRQQ